MNEKPLFALTPTHPREGLLSQVLSVIQARQNASRLWRIRVSVSAGLLSLAALIPVGKAVMQAFAASHVGAYVALMFSDTSVVFSSWKEISALLLESLPFAIMTLALALLGVFAYAARVAFRSYFSNPIMSTI